MSERVERRLVELLNSPKYSPYGNAIPGLEELGITSERDDPKTVTLSIAAKDSSPEDRFTLARFPEVLQADIDVMKVLGRAGMERGSVISIEPKNGAIHVLVDGYDEGVDLDPEVADHIVVKRGA